ncbi:MAG: hypothetical protein WBF33_08055 [Candidatus Nitrosopolaris sp.]
MHRLFVYVTQVLWRQRPRPSVAAIAHPPIGQTILGVWFLPKHLYAKYDYAHYDVPKDIRNHCYRVVKIKRQLLQDLANGTNQI